MTEGSAQAMRPPSSIRPSSSGQPYPLRMHQPAPWTITSWNWLLESFTNPFTPTPAGTARYSPSTSSRSLGRTSASVRFVRRRRMPQLISNPIPPGEITPSFTSKAATPPMGNP